MTGQTDKAVKGTERKGCHTHTHTDMLMKYITAVHDTEWKHTHHLVQLFSRLMAPTQSQDQNFRRTEVMSP